MTTKDAARAALITALFTFTALFLPGAFGWLQDVVDWASSSDRGAFPDVSVLGSAFLAAIGAAATGLLNFVYRFAQAQGWLGGTKVTYAKAIDTTARDA